MSRIIIAGDYCPRCETENRIEQGDFESVFGGVKEITAKADLSIVNLECPILVGKGSPIKKAGPCLKASPKAIDALMFAGFNMVTLANNHIYDQGENGINDTLQTLENKDVKHVGAGHNLEEAVQTAFVIINRTIIAIINCCEHEFSIASDNSGGANPLNPIQQSYAIKSAKEKADFVLVIVHGGHEHYNLPSPRMVETYRFFVDCGADTIINHHQHCYSGYEVYQGKPIFYGLGNFCFDWEKGQRSKQWYEGYMVGLNFNKDAVTFDLLPYTQCLNSTSVVMCNIDDFDNKIQTLNQIISDSTLLIEKHQGFLDSNLKLYDYCLEPYKSSFLKKLFFRGIIPHLMNKDKKILIDNFVECESHRDKFIYYLNKTRLS